MCTFFQFVGMSACQKVVVEFGDDVCQNPGFLCHLLCDPTIWQPGFDLPRQQWSLLNRFHMEQGHCGACRRKWRLTDTDLCPCGEIQTMSHIVESCPLTILHGSLSRLHTLDEDAVSWLTSYGSWHAYEKQKNRDHSSKLLSFWEKHVFVYAFQVTYRQTKWLNSKIK